MLPDAEVVVAIRGLFDAPAAARLRAACMEAARTNHAKRIVVDFSRATEITDIALAILIEQQVAGEGPRLRFRGLSKRHNRMLRYLGSRGEAIAG